MIQRVTAFIDVLKQSTNPFKVILGQLLVKTGLNRYFTIQMNGYKLRFSKSALAITLFADNNDRHDDEDVLKKILAPGDTYVDVGANIGTLVFTAAGTVLNTGKVIAIEAHPQTFNILKANVEFNRFSNIRLIHSAAGNKKGSLFFSNINSDDQNKVLLKNESGIEVEVQTLDDLLHDVKDISVLKIDVEGYEKFVLEGAADTLKKTNIILYESWDKHFKEFGYDTGSIIRLLNNQGFKVYSIQNDTIVKLLPEYRSVACENLLALKNTESFCSKNNFLVKDLNDHS